MSVHIGVFWLILDITVSVEGWTYHWKDNMKLNWTETKEWCRKHYTDIVMIDNENVTHFLTEHLEIRNSAPYYWIGLKKSNNNWTWVANEQIVNYQNWGDGEPNNEQSDENCVEYISNKNNKGKWNDDSCSKQKSPVCHKAQCLNNSCSDRGHCIEQVNNFTCVCEPGFSGPRCEKALCLNNSCSNRGQCIEQVNNFTCVCEPGFSGPRCEKVVSCEQLSAPPHGWMECSGSYGNHSLSSKCKFSCAGGYKLRGTAELQCNSSGAWNVPQPSCAVDCFPLLLFGGGLMNCTQGHDSSRSACRVQCPPGHLLLGFTEFTCRADGMWESSFPLMCASFVHYLIALLASVVISLFCGCFCCSNCRKSKKAVRMRTQQETLNPAFEAEHTPLDGPLCSA